MEYQDGPPLPGHAPAGARSARTSRISRRQVTVPSNQQLGRLVEDLLFLARAEVGAIRFEMQPLILRDVLDLVLAEARILAGEHDIHIQADMPTEPCRIEADAERVMQALLVVLDNAVKYSETGSLIKASLVCGETEALISISSTGPGIPQGDLPYVFNRFYRGRQNPCRLTTGSGLGLPIAKWITDTHGGRVEIESSNRQTVVRLSLPMR